MQLRDGLMYIVLLATVVCLIVWGTSVPKTPQSTPVRPSQSKHVEPVKNQEKTELSSPETSQTSQAPHEEKTHYVTRVIDGDTFTTSDGKTIRMIGMNTPELYPRDGSSSECYAVEARARTIELIHNKNIRLVRDISETDKYGRLLRYVFVNDVFVNEELVTGGFARVRAYKPDTMHHTKLLAAMHQAKNTQRGLWGACK